MRAALNKTNVKNFAADYHFLRPESRSKKRQPFWRFLLWPKLIMSQITTQCVSFTKQWDQYADFWFRIWCSMFAHAAKLTKMVNLTKLVRIEMWWWILCWWIHDKDVLSVSDTGGLPPNGRCFCDLLVTSQDALPLRYRPFSLFNYVEMPDYNRPRIHLLWAQNRFSKTKTF